MRLLLNFLICAGIGFLAFFGGQYYETDLKATHVKDDLTLVLKRHPAAAFDYCRTTKDCDVMAHFDPDQFKMSLSLANLDQ